MLGECEGCRSTFLPPWGMMFLRDGGCDCCMHQESTSVGATTPSRVWGVVSDEESVPETEQGGGGVGNTLRCCSAVTCRARQMSVGRVSEKNFIVPIIHVADRTDYGGGGAGLS